MGVRVGAARAAASAPVLLSRPPTPTLPCHPPRPATPPGRVYLLDRRFLDPRRPHIPPGGKPTPAQAAEGLPPYAAELPLGGASFATLDHRVAGLRGVVVEAAVLESTQLMLAHGLDLFYTRLTPSK